VHGVRDIPPGGDLGVVPDAGNIRIPSCLRADEGCFGDQEGAWHGSALSVMLLDEGKRDMVIVDAEAGHWGHSYAVGKLYASNAQRSEKLGHAG
jgi:hypothetical protein